MVKNSGLTILSIGHSTRTFPEFVEILKTYHVTLVVDVCSVARSQQNPQFNKEILPIALKLKGVNYVHMPEIGGLRRPKPDSVNTAWRNKTFRGYADYIQTKEFTEQLLNLLALARENCVAIMCAEALPWRCHRSLIGDALLVRNVKVEHIISKESTITHTLTEWAHVEGTKITSALPEGDSAEDVRRFWNINLTSFGAKAFQKDVSDHICSFLNFSG